MNLKYLISKVELRVFAGVVVMTALVLSAFYFFQAIHTYLNQFENSNLLELIFFGSVLIILSLGFYIRTKIKMHKSNLPAERLPKESFQPSFYISLLAVKFVQGMLTGLTKPRPSKRVEQHTRTTSHENVQVTADQGL